MNIRRLSTVAIVVSFGFVLLASGGGHAATSAEIELDQCYNTCLGGYTSCTPTCCGLVFCRKSCIIGCFQNLDACDGDCRAFCSTCDPDGAFFDAATVTRDGRTVRTGGPLTCVEGATADIDVTVTQGAGGAVATGHAHVKCPREETSFTVDAKTTGTASFPAPGIAQACGTASIHAAGQSVDSFQWCREITLVPEGLELRD